MLAVSLIKDAFRLIGVTRPGQTPSADAQAEGLATLNAMLDAWSTERLMIPVIVRRVFDVTANQQTYTIGAAAMWAGQRPVRIERAGLVELGSETPIEVLSEGRWAQIPVKSQAGRPAKLYYDGAYPVGNVSLFPVPEDSSLDIALYCWAPLAAFADLAATSYDLPPGYQLAITYNLAGLLIPGFTIQNKSDMQQHQLVLDRAREQKAWVKMFNAPVLELSIDAALTGSGAFDITTGSYR